MAIRNVGHFEALIFILPTILIICNIIQTYHFQPYVFYCVLAVVIYSSSLQISLIEYSSPLIVML